MSNVSEYETLDSLLLSDGSVDSYVRRDSSDNYYDKNREKKQCMFVILYFLVGFSILLLVILIVCVLINLLKIYNFN